MRKSISFILFLFFIFHSPLYALTPEEILLLKRSGVSDEKILEMQKKEGVSSEPKPVPKINPFDWNEDGKKDIIAGSDSGRIYVYLNAGTNKEPLFDKAAEISGAEIMRFSKPSVVDWNNDGKKDILVGARSGEVSVFINRGDNQLPIFGGEIKLNDGEFDVGSFSSPAMVDWNGDGKKDLVVGNRSGKIFLFLNIGKNDAPSFSSKGAGIYINVDSCAAPFIADWNNDGKFDVICGSGDGKVYIFINEGDNKNPTFGKAQTLHVNNKELKLQSPTSIIAVDWDDDGKTDLLVSNKGIIEEGVTPDRKNIISFGIYLLLNTGTKEKPEFKELKPIKGKFRDDSAL
jgi:hypothetical protein